MLHEAQACTIIEALGALHYHGRSSTILTLLIERLHSVQQLLPHSAVALVHGLALLHVEPPAPLGIADIMRLMSASGLAIDPAEAGTLLWSLVQLGCAELAREAIRTLPVDIAETAQHADLHSLTLCLWSLLTLRCYEHRLTIAVLQAISQAASGVALPAQLCRIAECMLMLQLEAPPELGLVLPPLLCQKAQLAWQQVQLQVSCERSPQRSLSSLLSLCMQMLTTAPSPHRCRASARRSRSSRSLLRSRHSGYPTASRCSTRTSSMPSCRTT